MPARDSEVRQIEAKSGEDFWDLLSPEKPLFSGKANIIYRGQADSNWDLTPSFLRKANNTAELTGEPPIAGLQVVVELMRLNGFVRYCDSVGLRVPGDGIEFRKYIDQPNFEVVARNATLWPDERLFEVMALAQHHGLRTRLLDWSRRSYVAAYFAASGALERAHAGRFVVWALNIEMQGLFKELQVIRVPGGSSVNYAAQAGVFTLLRQRKEGRNRPFIGPMRLDEYFASAPTCPLVKVTAPVSVAPNVLDLCKMYGVTGATLYPDYYGAAKAALDDDRCWRANYQDKKSVL